MITNHYGITVDSDSPITGVLSINQVNIDTLMDEMYYQSGKKISLENYLFDNKFEDQTLERQMMILDSWEDSPDDTWLIGQWARDEDGLYIPDKSGEYAAIVRETTIQVVWSKYTIKVKSLCSPCYPGQADIHIDDNGKVIESKEGFMAYNLPDEFFIYNER